MNLRLLIICWPSLCFPVMKNNAGMLVQVYSLSVQRFLTNKWHLVCSKSSHYEWDLEGKREKRSGSGRVKEKVSTKPPAQATCGQTLQLRFWDPREMQCADVDPLPISHTPGWVLEGNKDASWRLSGPLPLTPSLFSLSLFHSLYLCLSLSSISIGTSEKEREIRSCLKADFRQSLKTTVRNIL